MPVLRLPSPLRPYANGKNEIQLHGSTVDMVLRELSNEYPQIKPHLYAVDGSLRSYVHLFVNDEDIDNLQGIGTPVAENDRVMIIPSVAGGSTP